MRLDRSILVSTKGRRKMGKGAALISVALLLICSAGLVAEAAADCTTSISSLLPCYQFLEGNLTSPPVTCCVALGAVAVAQPVCLCEVIGYGNISLPFQLNSTLAEELPKLCNVTADPSQCQALIVGSPTGSPKGAVTGAPLNSGASRKIPGTILSMIVQFAAVPAVASLLLRGYH